VSGAAVPRRGDPLLAAVRRYCRQQALLSRGTLVVAVSGGADSVCLLHLLHQLAGEFDLQLQVAHFNHGLRGAESDLDARLVAALADHLNLPASFGCGDVATAAKATHRSLEAIAHDMRWAFLEAVRRRCDATAVATGHTADDQAETVLMHLLRGSGLRGLAGMAPSGAIARRPLLAIRHSDCLAWCREHGVPWREDASNAEPWCRRNVVRLEVLPALRHYNPAIATALAGLAETVQIDLAYLDEQAEAAFRDLVSRADGGAEQLSLAGYQGLPEALRRHLLLRWLGPGARRAHIAAVDTLLFTGRAGDAVAVSGDRQVVRRYADAVLLPRGTPPPLPTVAVAVPGKTFAPGWDWTIEAELLSAPAVGAPGRWTVDLDPDRVLLPLTLRTRRPGDRLQLPGVAGATKLQDLLVDAKIPRRERDRIGVVEAANGIVWLAGQRAAGWALADAGSERVVRLTVLPNGNEEER
jgi:tRNA(Ile)-lysidine synthase